MKFITLPTMRTASQIPITIVGYSLLLICCFHLQACTAVHINGAETKVIHGFGITRIQIQPDIHTPLMVATEGVGIIGASKSITIGAIREFTVSFPDASACHTVIVVQNNHEFNNLRELLNSKPENFNRLCITNKEKMTWTP